MRHDVSSFFWVEGLIRALDGGEPQAVAVWAVYLGLREVSSEGCGSNILVDGLLLHALRDIVVGHLQLSALFVRSVKPPAGSVAYAQSALLGVVECCDGPH